jgi:predicted ATPase
MQRGGIPFHRGYLLYGVPGRGKTSLINSLRASELGPDIYVMHRSFKGYISRAWNRKPVTVPLRNTSFMGSLLVPRSNSWQEVALLDGSECS